MQEHLSQLTAGLGLSTRELMNLSMAALHGMIASIKWANDFLAFMVRSGVLLGTSYFDPPEIRSQN